MFRCFPDTEGKAIMPKGSEELTNSRKQEIVNACAQLYETVPFKEITLREIGSKTSFTRTSIYNYFHTKEEIFLALLQREYEAWIADLNELAGKGSVRTAGRFPAAFAQTLEKRRCMLKLLSMNTWDLEAGSRLENLTAFKTAYRDSLTAVSRCLEKFFPELTAKDRQEFIYALYPFLFGVYPYTASTEKQIEAMERAQVPFVRYSVREIVGLLVEKLLAGLCGRHGRNGTKRKTK